MPTATAVILTAGLLVAAPASATPAVERLQRDGTHFPVSVKTDVPAGGNSMITTPTIPRGTEALKVVVTPRQSATAEQKEVFDELTEAMGSMTRKNRFLACILLHNLVGQGGGTYEGAEYDVVFADYALLMLVACFKMAGLLAEPSGRPTTGPSRAAEACGKRMVEAPATVEEIEGGYRLTVAGDIGKTEKPKLRVRCRIDGHKMVYKVRSATKGQPVRRVVGKRLHVGILSPADAEASVPVKVTFRIP